MANPGFPWFPFYVRDWLTDAQVVTMPAIARGCYIQLLCHQWENGGLPHDEISLAGLCGISDRECVAFPTLEGVLNHDHPEIEGYGVTHVFRSEIWPYLEKHFPADQENGLRHNPRLEHERRSQIRTRQGNRLGGQVSAERRQSKSTSSQPPSGCQATTNYTDTDTDVEKKTLVRSKRNARPSSMRQEYPEEFSTFWISYPARNGKRLGKKATLKKWKSLSVEGQKLVLTAAQNYAKSRQAKDGKAKDPERFFKEEYWLDWADGPGDQSTDQGRELFTARDLEEYDRQYDEGLGAQAAKELKTLPDERGGTQESPGGPGVPQTSQERPAALDGDTGPLSESKKNQGP